MVKHGDLGSKSPTSSGHRLGLAWLFCGTGPRHTAHARTASLDRVDSTHAHTGVRGGGCGGGVHLHALASPSVECSRKRQHIEGRCSTPALGGPNRPSAARPLVIAARRGLLPQWVAARRRWSHRRSTCRPALPPPLPLGRRRSI